jgi:hypothetical protein
MQRTGMRTREDRLRTARRTRAMRGRKHLRKGRIAISVVANSAYCDVCCLDCIT